MSTDTSNGAIESTVKNLEWIYAVVIALAISEAFMQFALPPGPKVSGIQWDRFLPLCSLLLLVIPFFHGMGRYLCDMYHGKEIGPRYGVWLLTDCFAFTVEAGFFFVLAHSLSKDLWLQFNAGVVVLLFWDVLWGTYVWKYRTEKDRACSIRSWVIVNLCTIPLLASIVAIFYRSVSWWAMLLPFVVILVRTIADYWTGWEFYFPKPERPEAQ